MQAQEQNMQEKAGCAIWRKLRGGAARPARFSLAQIAMAAIGGGIAIAFVASLAALTQSPLVLGSFGASCVLLFGYPDSPFSQPRNVIGGHVVASFMGLLCLALLGAHWWSMALAAMLAIAAMHLTGTVHPPAGSNPIIVMLLLPGWDFLWMPTLLGAVLLVLVAIFFNNLPKERSYPKYWF